MSCDSDGVIKVWDIRMVKEQVQFDIGAGSGTSVVSANSVIFDKSGSYVFVAAEDKSIQVFNLATGEKDG